MFNEDVTQYCPMCKEWSEKYEKEQKKVLIVQMCIREALLYCHNNGINDKDLTDILKEGLHALGLKDRNYKRQVVDEQ